MMKKIVSTFLVFLNLLLGSCNSQQGETSDNFLGNRYQVILAKSADQKEWVEAQGLQEWFFFAASTFRQDSSSYIEPQFYGESRKCSASASGAFFSEEDVDSVYENAFKVVLSYTGAKYFEELQEEDSTDLEDEEGGNDEVGNDEEPATAQNQDDDQPKEISPLCRVTDRQITIVVQPSGAVDLIDGPVIQRLEKIEDIK